MSGSDGGCSLIGSVDELLPDAFEDAAAAALVGLVGHNTKQNCFARGCDQPHDCTDTGHTASSVEVLVPPVCTHLMNISAAAELEPACRQPLSGLQMDLDLVPGVCKIPTQLHCTANTAMPLQ